MPLTQGLERQSIFKDKTAKLLSFTLVSEVFFLFCFLEPLSWHMEFPSPGVESELQLWTYATASRSKWHLQPTRRFTALPDPKPAERGQGWNNISS